MSARQNVPTHSQTVNQDYIQSGFDRGHLAPAANHRASAIAMKSTFYFSNTRIQ